MDRIRIALVQEPLSLEYLGHAECLLGLRPGSDQLERILHEPRPDPTEQLHRLAADVLGKKADAVLWPASTLPLQLPAGLLVGSLFRCTEYGYRLVTREIDDAEALRELPAGSRVLACDPIARAQILFRFPGLCVGFADSSAKVFGEVARGEWNAACVPAEALDLGVLDGLRVSSIPPEQVLPVVGQGVVALLVAERNGSAVERIQAISDPVLGAALGIERTFLRSVSDVADAVATARTIMQGTKIDLTGILAGQDGEWLALDGALVAARFKRFVAEEVADGCRELARHERAGIVSVGELVAAGAVGSIWR